MPHILKPVFKHFFIRYLHSSLLEDVAQLECHSGECLWSKDDIKDMMYDHKFDGFVIKSFDKPVGYVVYENLGLGEVHLINLVVHPDYRRQKLGTTLINCLKNQIGSKCSIIMAHVRESNLNAHLFLKDVGFKATTVAKNFFEDYHYNEVDREDAFCFHFDTDMCISEKLSLRTTQGCPCC